tara:strand:- start:179 stop:481 length:303 start_codon:yes stop_codon:yes gene_type:complete
MGRVFYSVGRNHYQINHNNGTCHAEVDAIQRLKPARPFLKKKDKNVKLLVFRTNKRGDCLLMAKPCSDCEKRIRNIIPKKGYNLTGIHYTDHNGQIIKIS